MSSIGRHTGLGRAPGRNRNKNTLLRIDRGGEKGLYQNIGSVVASSTEDKGLGYGGPGVEVHRLSAT